MKFKKNDKVIYYNIKGKVRDIIIEKKQISIFVEFDNLNEIGIFNHEGYLYQSDKQFGELYKLKIY